MEVRSAFNYDRDKASMEAGLECNDLTRTIQSQKEEADINTILMRFGITGKLPQNPKVPKYGDFTEIHDFQSALQAVKNAEDDFMALPAHIRERFKHNPQELLIFIENEANREEAIKLGLIEPAVASSTQVEAKPAADSSKTVAEKTQ